MTPSSVRSVTSSPSMTGRRSPSRSRTSCEMEVVDTGPNKKGDIGTTWYERFYYPETEKGSGEYENRPGTKIGNLTTARYGEGLQEDGDAVLKAGISRGSPSFVVSSLRRSSAVPRSPALASTMTP